MGLVVHVVPCLHDNYAYVLQCSRTNALAVVDPGESGPVIETVAALGGRLEAVFATHHHRDHTGGAPALLERFPDARFHVHVQDRARIAWFGVGLEEGIDVPVGELMVHVLHVPGHTLGSVAYRVEDAVFTGDTLFGGGCGRLFEGTAAMMYRSLNHRLDGLPGSTRVYFGHEYTVDNLMFARTLEPRNEILAERLKRAMERISAGGTTVPSTLALERRTNPFLRCGLPELSEAVAAAHGKQVLDPVGLFEYVRALKDRF